LARFPALFALNSGAIRLKRPKNLTQIGFPSLRSVKSDRLLARILHELPELSVRYTERLVGIEASGGSVVDSHDKVLAETINTGTLSCYPVK
jgi:hypothetical protein